MPKTTITDEERERAESYFESYRNKDYTQEEMASDYERVVKNEDNILGKGKKMGSEKLENIKLLFSMIKDYFSGEYKEVPFPTIVAMIMTLLYVFSPIDVIPDIIPVAGLLDDASVVAACIGTFASTDLKRYKEWKKNKK
ncbi:MAG: YkvA family protein [Spirochaetales bacterium]|nr:YkvA family protein [Spirochaetales bacterium]